MADIIKTLIDERASVFEASKKVLNAAEAEKRPLSAEEKATLDAHDKRIDEITDEVTRRERNAKLEADLSKSRGRIADATDPITSKNADPSEAITLKAGRHDFVVEPGTPAHARAMQSYRNDFAGYLRDPRRNTTLQVASDPGGGYLVPTQIVAGLIKALDNMVFMRQLATVLPPTNAKSLGVVTLENDPSDADWTAEIPASALTADSTMSFGRRDFSPTLLAKLVKMSMKLLRSADMNIEQLITDRLAYKFGVVEENKFLNGTGASQPLGIFTASADGVPTSRDVTATNTTSFVGDDLIETMYATKAQYRSSGVWITSRAGVKMARKLKDGNGQYLWQPGLQGGEPATILGRPVYESEYAPSTFTTGLYVAIFCDLKAGYWIADGLSLSFQMLNELYAATNQVGIIARKETDGAPVLAEAFSRLKLA